MSGSDPVVPVLRPLLPPAEHVLPYLRRIDETRIYTNWGPLTAELESRLCDRFGIAPGGVASAASGTHALVGAILAAAGRPTTERPLAILPSFTFVATAVAAEEAGYEVALVDVDPKTLAVDPSRLFDGLLARAGVVIPVAPFGIGVPQEPWLELRRRTGCQVVIDGAASFEQLERAPQSFVGEIPVALSFHATKTFACGEGGAVVTTDLDLAQDVVGALNFGFRGTREAVSGSINGKMSEYHAAVALASLDVWDETQSVVRAVSEAYRDAFRAIGFLDRLRVAPEIASCYVLFEAADETEATVLREGLADRAVDTRIWYGGGVHTHAHFAASSSEPLPNTDLIAPRLVGLPTAPDLPGDAVRHVAEAVAAVLAP